MYKLIIFDIDGTISDRDTRLPLPNVTEWFASNTYPVAFATNQGGAGMHLWMKSAGFGTPDDFPTETMCIGQCIDKVILAGGDIEASPIYHAFRHQDKAGNWSPVPAGKDDDPSWSKEWRKPQPGMLLQAMNDADVLPSETLFVGDFNTDYEAAAHAGCSFAWADEFFGRETIVGEHEGWSNGAVWTNTTIAEWASAGNVEPYDEDLVGPASFDMCWSGRYRYNDQHGWSDVHEADEVTMLPDTIWNRFKSAYRRYMFDDHTYVVGLALLDTMEYIKMPSNAAGILQLKSSRGRAGLEHSHAGFVEPDFQGTLTLEMEHRLRTPYRLVRGQAVVQLVLLQTDGLSSISYAETGHYNGQDVPTTSFDGLS